ncbi:MAG: tetratricopeptide repeat protein, partial [Sphingobacteriaceae bacterium]
YYHKAEKLAGEIKDEELVADCQNNKGTVYEQLKEYDKALATYKKALDVYTRKNITSKISMALSNIAIVYKYQKNYKGSLEYNRRALELSAKTGDKWMMSATYNNMGNLYGQMGDYKNAVVYCGKALEIAKQINAIEIIESIYDSLSEAAAKAGDYKSAYTYHKNYSDANSKFINIESAKQLSELNVKFETERKQKLIQEQQFEISRRNYWLYGALIALVLISAVGYLVIRNNKYKQDKRIQAEIQKQHRIATRSLFEGEQNERIRIARDLHDSIGQMLSVIKMNVSVIPESKVTLNTLKLVDSTIAEVRNISRNLIPEELYFGLFRALEDMCEKINSSNITQVSINVPGDVREHQFEKSNELSIYRIVQEVLNNMVKHSQASLINLDVTRQGNSFNLAIKDNGKGFDTDMIDKSKGLGWKNIAARVNMLDGKMEVRSEKLIGTQIEIVIPGA